MTTETDTPPPSTLPTQTDAGDTSATGSGVVRQLGHVASDIKLSHSVFALPFALLATFLAAGGWPGWWVLGLIVACMVTARTVAMCANRLLDMRLDALNPRTAQRALPGGRVSVGLYVGVMGAAAVLFHAACAGFYFLLKNPWPVMWSVPVLAFVCLYPLLKRFTRWCHFYLGIALALAPVCACLAVAGEVKSFAWVMAGAVWLWTSGFDILYATQDLESDRLTGVFSVPAALGVPAALWVARVCHGVSALLLLSLPAFESQLALLYVLGAVAAVVLLIAQHLMVKPNDLSRINLAFFTLNGAVSLVLGGLGIADVLI